MIADGRTKLWGDRFAIAGWRRCQTPSRENRVGLQHKIPVQSRMVMLQNHEPPNRAHPHCPFNNSQMTHFGEPGA